MVIFSGSHNIHKIMNYVIERLSLQNVVTLLQNDMHKTQLLRESIMKSLLVYM